MHPLSISARRYDAGVAQIREMPRNFWLAHPENLNEIANTNLPIRDQVQQPQSGFVSQRTE